MSDVVSKCGVHCIGPNRTGYGAFLQRIDMAGRRLSLVKCRDNFGAIDEPLALWPDVLIVGAFTQFDGFPFDYAAFEERAKLNPKIKVWEVLNEINGIWEEQAELYISLAPQFAANGWALCMFNCASGTPPYPEEDGGFAYSMIAEACHFMKDNGYPAYLGLHEYVLNEHTIGRFARLADYLEAQGALLPISITEYGFETHPGDDALMEMVKQNDPIYMADDRVLGCALWTLGGGGWAGSNYQTALPALGEYIATVEPLEPIPDDEWELDYWDLDGARIDGNPIDIEMNANHRLTPHAKKRAGQLKRFRGGFCRGLAYCACPK